MAALLLYHDWSISLLLTFYSLRIFVSQDPKGVRDSVQREESANGKAANLSLVMSLIRHVTMAISDWLYSRGSY